MEFHGIPDSIVVLNSSDFRAHFRFDAQLLLQFPAESRSGFFIRFYLAAGKFPFQRMRLMLGPLANQDFIIFNDERHHHLFLWATVFWHYCDYKFSAQRRK